jgi:putative glutamine amidotransferase
MLKAAGAAGWLDERACVLEVLTGMKRAGADAIVFDATHDPDSVIEQVDALILGGGPDVDPATYGHDRHIETYGSDLHVDEFEFALLAAALVREMPVLAICRGIQVVNVAYGGTLHQHIVDDPGVAPHGKPGDVGEREERPIIVTEGSLLASVIGATNVTGSCHHHPAVDQVGAGLRVTARADDGIVEGLQLDNAWLLAVQWHPEDTAASDAAQQALFDALVAQAS